MTKDAFAMRGSFLMRRRCDSLLGSLWLVVVAVGGGRGRCDIVVVFACRIGIIAHVLVVVFSPRSTCVHCDSNLQ
jgi:hypothetical protein